MFKIASLATLLILTTACVPVTYETHIYDNNMEAMEQHYQQGNDINRLDYWGTPLAYAARINNLAGAQFLIDKGAEINKGNPEGYESKTPMHAAAAHNSVDVAKLLLANGADLSIRNRENLTPLQVAKAEEQQDMIDLLSEVTMQQSTWKKTQALNTAAAYKSFIDAYPNSPFREQAQSSLDTLMAEQQAAAAQKAKLEAMEAQLPANVRRDKYMVSLSKYLKAGDYTKALEVFPKLEQLPITKDPSLYFFYGEALLKTGQPSKALGKLYQYINEQGSRARHYTRALELINQAESEL